LLRKLVVMAQRLGVRIVHTTPMSSKFSNGVTVFTIVTPRNTINHKDLYDCLYGKKGEANRFAVGFIPERKGDNPHPEVLRICLHIMNLPAQISAVVHKIATFIIKDHDMTMEELNAISVEEYEC